MLPQVDGSDVAAISNRSEVIMKVFHELPEVEGSPAL